MGVSGRFFVTCKLGPEQCNHHVCPVWNSDEVQELESQKRIPKIKLKEQRNQGEDHGTSK
jgi:hypothetical protein